MAEIITVSKTDEGTRLMRWFQRRWPSMPARDFYRLCRGGQIRLNSSRVRGTEILRAGDAVRVPPTLASYAVVRQKQESGNQFSLADLEKLRKCIIHNDEDIVVFNKPAGLAVQGGSGIRCAVDKMAAAMFPYDKISLVHRLDRETSGVLVVAKNHNAAQILSAAFQDKSAYKEYLALLYGDVRPMRGTIDNYIMRGDVYDAPVRTDAGARAQRAVTDYEVLTNAGKLSWILFKPHTGRTHQLRVHSAVSLNAPIVGDDLYGGKTLATANNEIARSKKLFLLAYKITFQHPRSRRMVTFRADAPDFMSNVMRMLELKMPGNNAHR